MVKKIKTLSLILILSLILPLNILAKQAIKIDNLTIMSESNMTYPLVKIARLYSQNYNSILSINFNSSSDLIQNIDDGEPANVFISSHPDWAETLKHKGLIDIYNVINIAKDKLVLITSNKNKKININRVRQASNINNLLRELKRTRTSLIIDSTSTSLGKYTQTILDGINIKNNQIIFQKVSEDKKSVVEFVNEHNGFCGIVLASAVQNYDDIIILKTFNNIEIYYQAFTIAGSDMKKARDFSKFINSEAAKEILSQGGFIVK